MDVIVFMADFDERRDALIIIRRESPGLYRLPPEIFSEIPCNGLYYAPHLHLTTVMRGTNHYFGGRGKGISKHQEPYRCIRCETGTVMEVIINCHGVEFILGYCRNALWDQWGLYCGDVFVRKSNSSFTRTWAVPLQRGLFFFKPIRLELVEEQNWMRQSR